MRSVKFSPTVERKHRFLLSPVDSSFQIPLVQLCHLNATVFLPSRRSFDGRSAFLSRERLALGARSGVRSCTGGGVTVSACRCHPGLETSSPHDRGRPLPPLLETGDSRIDMWWHRRLLLFVMRVVFCGVESRKIAVNA